MKEQYETQEKKTAALQYLPVLSVAWRDREITEDESAMLATFAADVLKIPSLMTRLSDQYRAMQRYNFAKDKELRYMGKQHGVDAWLPVKNGEERLLDKDTLTREFAQFLRLTDQVHESRTGKKPSTADRNSRDYVETISSLLGDFGTFYYLNKKIPAKNKEMLGTMIQGNVDPYSFAHTSLTPQGEEFERLESAVMNMLNEGKIQSDPGAVRSFFDNRFGKTYAGSEFDETLLEVRLSGLEMRNIIFKALRGESDVFKDTVEFNARCVPLLNEFSKDAAQSMQSGLSDRMKHLHRKCAEANFDGAYDISMLFKESREAMKFRQVQFEDMKHLMVLLQVAMEDGVITDDEKALYKTMSMVVGLPTSLTDFMLTEQIAGKVLEHPEFR